jgi:hypothetical protein
MKALRIILGIFGLLLAILGGGCSLLYFANQIYAAFTDTHDLDGIGVYVIAVGLLPAVIGGVIARWAFGKRPADPVAPSPEDNTP